VKRVLSTCQVLHTTEGNDIDTSSLHIGLLLPAGVVAAQSTDNNNNGRCLCDLPPTTTDGRAACKPCNGGRPHLAN